LANSRNAYERLVPYFYVLTLHFYLHIIAMVQFMESYDGEGDYYGKKCNLFVQS